MFNWLPKKARATRFVGIDAHDEGLAVALIEVGDAGAVIVRSMRWCPLDTGAPLKQAIADVVREVGARGLPVFATLPHSAYSLVQLEAPDLAEDELRDAMRWRVKDLIDFPVEQSVIDVFKLPASHRPGAPGLLYVVVAQAQAVSSLAEALVEAGLVVEAIDVVELAIRNLAMHLDRPRRPRAYLHLQPEQTIIEIADGPQVYLGRRVMQHYDADADPALLHAQMENLALEVQRSLDYFESQYALGPTDRLSAMVGDDVLFGAFAAVASNFLTVPVERFNFDDIAFADDIPAIALDRGVTALGAAMRGLPWAA